MTHAAAAEPVPSNDTATNDLTLCPALAFQQTAMGGSAFIHGKILARSPMCAADHDTDEKGRMKTPAFLLTGHKAN